ncbi:hypothetical protein GX865_00795 [Candidatus Saccharibacteria bacterium]|jgi:hypothetical protein|nr:hypothetical protein [Candidatus Saccharibacteria bacterium]
MSVNTHPSITSQDWKESAQAISAFNDARSVMQVENQAYRTSLTSGEDNRVKPIIKISSQLIDYIRTAHIDSVIDLYQELDVRGDNLSAELIWLSDGIGVWIRFDADSIAMLKGSLQATAEVEIKKGRITLINSEVEICLKRGPVQLPQEVIDLVQDEASFVQLSEDS